MSKTISAVKTKTIEHELVDARETQIVAKTALAQDAIARRSGKAKAPDLREAAHDIAKPAAAPSLGPAVSGIPYADLINAAEKKYGLPPALLAGLSRTESSFNPNVVSSRGAIGLTQLEPATAGDLENGSTGNAVRTLQYELGVTADGDFGPKTKAAIERFQRAHGLEVDGVVGPQTRAALAASRPELSQGATSANVKAIQQAVEATVDGDFGPKTKAAVENFQRSHGLQGDGIVGPETWADRRCDCRNVDDATELARQAPVTSHTGPARPTGPAGSANATNARTLAIAESRHTHEATGNNDDDGNGKIHAYQSTTGALNQPWRASFVS